MELKNSEERKDDKERELTKLVKDERENSRKIEFEN